MALFGSKKKTKADDARGEAVTTPKAKTGFTHALDTTSVLVRPRITEKASVQAETANVYSFEISKDATKVSVRQAVQEFYKVTPKRVAIVNLPSKERVIRGKKGIRSGVRKAYVYLKKGDKIEFV